jgi:hypothetical protein
MLQLKKLLFKLLPNGAHYDFCSRVSLLIASSASTIIAALGVLVTQFNAWLAKEKAWMDWVRKNVLTEQIEEADRRMDHALTAIRAQVRAQEFSLTATTAQIAHRVYIMLMSYGDVNSKPYREQSGDIRDILQQVTGTGKYAADASTLGLSPFINELQAAFTLFDQLITQRGDESLQKPDESFRDVRRGIEEVYHQIETIINANAVVYPSSVYTAFINKLNPEIDLLNAEFHRVRYDISESQPEQIAPQTYTGKPLTPVPKVLYVTQHDGTVQLELGKDFDVSFDRNVDVGVADCHIHGKGAYRGSKSVTFVIVRAL